MMCWHCNNNCYWFVFWVDVFAANFTIAIFSYCFNRFFITAPSILTPERMENRSTFHMMTYLTWSIQLKPNWVTVVAVWELVLSPRIFYFTSCFQLTLILSLYHVLIALVTCLTYKFPWSSNILRLCYYVLKPLHSGWKREMMIINHHFVWVVHVQA